MGKQSKLGPKATKPPKGKNPFKPNVFANKNKGVQCRECDGFGHIQYESANTLKNVREGNGFGYFIIVKRCFLNSII